MLAFTVLAGCHLLAQARRIQPEAARLAPQVSAGSLGYQQVPAITLAAMRTVGNVDVADPWGVRDPPRIFASRASMELVEDAVRDLGPHSNTDVLLQAEFLPPGILLAADVGTDLQAETNSVLAALAEARTKLSELHAKTAQSAEGSRVLRKVLTKVKSELKELQALACEEDIRKETEKLENFVKELEKDLEKREAKLAEQGKIAAGVVKVDAQAQKDTSTKENAVAVASVADKGAPAVVGKIESQPGLEKVEPQKDAAGTVKVEAQDQKDTKKADMGDAKAVAATQTQKDTKKVDMGDAKAVAATPAQADTKKVDVGDAKAVAATQAQKDTKKVDIGDAKAVAATQAGVGQKDSRQKFAEAKDKVSAAKAELDASRAKLDASRAELEKAEQSLNARKQEYAETKDKKLFEVDGSIKEFNAINKKELEAKQAALEKEKAALEREKQEVEEMNKELQALRQKLEQQDMLTSTISSSSKPT